MDPPGRGNGAERRQCPKGTAIRNNHASKALEKIQQAGVVGQGCCYRF